MPDDGCAPLGHSITVGNAPPDGNDPSAGAEPHQVIVRTHQRMRAARRHHHAERTANVVNTLIDGQCCDGEMIEIQHWTSALLWRRLVPLAGIEPALLAELDFEVERVYQFRHRGFSHIGRKAGGREAGGI